MPEVEVEAEGACHPITSSPRKRKGNALVVGQFAKQSRVAVASAHAIASGPSSSTQARQEAQPLPQSTGGIVTTFFSPVFSLFRKGQHDGPHTSHDTLAVASASVSTSTYTVDEPEVDETAGADEALGADHVSDVDPSDSCENEGMHSPHPSPPADYPTDLEALLFIKNLPALEECASIHRQILLPRQTRRTAKKTLVLDLDETLVHSSMSIIDKPDFIFPVTYSDQQITVRVRRRPHLDTFITRVAELYEVVVFTASQKVYAEKVLNVLDPDRKLIRHRIYRESCVFVEGNYMKDLSVLGRDLKDTLIVDNSPQAFGFQLDNGIPIESWYDDDADQELLKLLPFLESLVHVEDVRPHIQGRYNLRNLINGIDESMFLLQ